MILAVLSLGFVFTAEAHPLFQRQCYNARNYNYRGRTIRKCRNVRVQHNHNRSFYRRHRNASNIAIATGAGAVLGGITRGKKGALIGGAIGAGAGTVYTYKIKPKKPRYPRY